MLPSPADERKYSGQVGHNRMAKGRDLRPRHVPVRDEDGAHARRVGGEPLARFVPYTHRQRLYSLAKCKEFSELSEWAEAAEVSLPKLKLKI